VGEGVEAGLNSKVPSPKGGLRKAAATTPAHTPSTAGTIGSDVTFSISNSMCFGSSVDVRRAHFADETPVFEEFLVDPFGGNVYQSPTFESPMVYSAMSATGSGTSSGSLVVKNTFIHLEEEEEDPCSIVDFPPRSISTPNVLHKQLLTPTSANEAFWSSPLICGVDSTSEVPEADEISDVDSEALGDAPSVGSRFHASGTCRPCAWFWKHQGCSNGRQCRHCHLCPQGEIKRRRKTKFVAMRNEKQLSLTASGGVEGNSEQ
jgi:hypothetical protein